MTYLREMRRQRRRIRNLTVLLIVAAVLSYLLHEQIIRGVFSPLLRGVIYRVETDRKVVSLTFDVVWMPAETGKILDVLDRYQLSATFFLTGNWVRRNPDLAREIIMRGHEIGQHTFSHQRLPELGDNELTREFEQMEKALRDELNVTTELFRPPYGEIDERVRDFAAARGYTTVLWSVDPHDWLNPGAEPLARNVLQKVHPGAIILLHTSAGQLPEALPAIIEGLRAKGFAILPLSVMLSESRKVGAD
jgi:peptidoglycan/xylan/chitin deacetylase (PgdA/CDA1 family)